MYTEDYENRGFPFRDFLLKLILIIIFVFLLVWLLPKFIKPSTVENKETIKEISALSSQIFNDNLNKMKEAAILYYTDERLPKEVGKYHQMTLSEMIGQKIITPLIDKNNKAVDVEKSYVKITKAEDEYILKVNIKDSEKEDYILVHLGCYTYCDGNICEKDENILIKGAKSSSNPISNQNPKPNSNPSPKPNPNPQPGPQPIPEEEEKKPTPTQTTYDYEYKKTFVKLTDWKVISDTRVACSTQGKRCSTNDVTCLKETERYSKKEQIGTYKKIKTEYKQVNSVAQTTCTGYNYIIVENKTYVVSSTYNKVNNITGSTQKTTGTWRYDGRKSYSNPPRDTATVHYQFVGADYSYCNVTCESIPNFYYDKYVYVGSMSQVTSTTTKPSGSSSSVTATCTSTTTTTVPIYGYVNVEDRAPLYGNVCYLKTKERSIYNSFEYKWSSYNDTSLLNNGWSYTGNKKQVN